jgi:PAS domain S-box-containing protein
MDTNLRPSGIEGLRDMAWGTHFCMFYDTKEDLLDILIPYFKAGLESHEFCLYVASEPVIAEEAERALREAVPNFERYLAEGQIEIVSHSDWYLSGGHFDPLRVRQAWIDKLNRGLTQGNEGMRFAANTFWLEQEDWDSFTGYEGKVDETFRQLRILALCAYALERCSAADMLNVVRYHQFTLAKRNGVWEHLGGSELKRAHDEIRQLNADLERRVLERTAQLAATNEQLRQEASERKQAEALLHAREQEFRAFVENAPDQIIRYDKEFRRTYVNPAVSAAYGLPKEAFIGKPVGSILEQVGLTTALDQVTTIRRQIKSVFDTGKATEYEVTFPLPGGRRTFWTRMYPEFDPNGVVINVLGISRDITERKQAEEAIRKSEQVLREAESLGHTGSWEQNLVTGEIFNTDENLHLFFGDDQNKGVDLEDYAEAVHPDDREYVMQRRVQLLTERGPSDIDYRVVWPDGSVHVIFGRATVVYDKLGKALRVYGTNVDITERKRAEEALRESEEKFSAAFRASPIALVIATLDGKYIEMNQAFCELLGYSREELLGKTAVDIGIFNAETRREWLEAIERAGGVMTNVEFNFRLRNGISRTTLFSVETIALQGIPHRLTTILDITERKRVEEALRISEKNFRTLADKSLEGIQLYQGGRSVYANAAMTALMGYSQEELKAMSSEEHIALVHSLDRAIAVERARKRQAGQEVPASLEVRILTKAGATRWVQGFTNEIEYNGQPAILSTAIDITERKRAEEAFRLSEQRFQLLTETIPILVWSARADGVSDYYNEPFLQYLGRTLEEMHGWAWVNTLHPDDRERSSVVWMRAFSSGSDYEIEYRIRRAADGQYRWHLGRAVPLRDSSGTIVRWYGTCTDIHDRKRAEEEMNRHAARAETLARIAARLNKQLDLDAVIHAVCEEAINTFKISQATMSLYDKKRDLLVYTGGVNIPPEYVASMEPITRSQFDDFLQEMGPIIVVPDIQSLPDVPNAEFSSHLDVRTVVTATMLRDQELVGVLVIGVNGHVREFDQDELTLLKALSDQAAQAIANALLLKAANEQHEQLRALSAKLVEAQETERQALTTELHDRVGQNLTGLSINLQNMKALLSNEMAKTLATKFDDAQELVQDTTRHVRDIMAELHPPELEDYGLAVALETYAERAALRGNLELIADLPDLGPPLPSDVRIALFRAAQEAISNVLKHANATQLEVNLKERNGQIILMVEDNGRGFEPGTASQKEAQTWGLKIMHERIESFGGKVQIESILGQGTRVTFEIARPS